MNYPEYVVLSVSVVAVLSAYILYLTSRLEKAEELNRVFYSNSREIRDNLNRFERRFPALYFTHSIMFDNIRKCTYNRI